MKQQLLHVFWFYFNQSLAMSNNKKPETNKRRQNLPSSKCKSGKIHCTKTEDIFWARFKQISSKPLIESFCFCWLIEWIIIKIWSKAQLYREAQTHLQKACAFADWLNCHQNMKYTTTVQQICDRSDKLTQRKWFALFNNCTITKKSFPNKNIEIGQA